MRLRIPIRFKILVVVAVLLLAAMSAYLVLATRLFRRDKLAYVFDLNSALTKSLAEQTRATLFVAIEQGRLLAREMDHPEITPEQRDALAAAMFDRDPDLIQVIVVTPGPGGEPIVTGAYQNQKAFDELGLSPGDLPALRRGIAFDAVSGVDDALVVNSSLPPDAGILTLVAQRRVGGWVVIDVNQQRLLRLFERFAEHQPALVDRHGLVIAHPDAAQVIDRRDLSGDPLVAAATTSGLSSQVKEFDGADGRSYLGAHAGVGLGGLVVISRIDRAEALRGVEELVRRSFLFGAAILLAAFIVSVFFSRVLSSPIRRLSAAAERVGRGDFDVDVKVASRDEIGDLAATFAQMAARLKESQRVLAEKERLEKELEIAAQLQTSILPRKTTIGGLEVAARMVPASSVGGDYYDVLPTEGGGWLGIGDVAGHGLPSGVVMLMLQSCVAALVRRDPKASPRDALIAVNQVLFENVRDRMELGKFVTLSLLRYDRGGKVVFAGAHLDLLVCRATTGRCETVPTPGTWIGVTRDITRVTVESHCELAAGDLLVLYTDGIVEAMDAKGEEFGMERLAAEIEQRSGAPAGDIVDAVLARVKEWRTGDADDLSLVVARRLGEAS